MKTSIIALAAVGALFALPVATHAAELETGQFIRSSDGTVYWFAENERRYVFPDGATLQSWLGGTPGMLNDAPDADLEQYPVGGPMTMRPGARLVRFDSDPTTYVVTRGAVLRRVEPAYAAAYYGDDWQQKIDTLSAALFSNYKLGAPIEVVSDFDRGNELAAVSTPERDLELRRANGLLPKSVMPFKAEVTFTAEVVQPAPEESPTTLHFAVGVTNQNTAVTNLRVDVYREEGDIWHKACRGIDRCLFDVDYSQFETTVNERYYAITSNDKDEKLSRVYSPYVTFIPMSAQ